VKWWSAEVNGTEAYSPTPCTSRCCSSGDGIEKFIEENGYGYEYCMAFDCIKDNPRQLPAEVVPIMQVNQQYQTMGSYCISYTDCCAIGMAS